MGCGQARRGWPRAIGKFLPALTPSSSEDPEVTRSSMALFAIVVPVIIVAVAATVYIHYGRTAQYTQNYDMALAQAAQARSQTNPTDVRRAWDSTIYYLDLADKDLQTQDSSTLRQEAQTALDNLDGILRLDFRPAIVSALSSTRAGQPYGCHRHRPVPAGCIARRCYPCHPERPELRSGYEL